MQTVFPLIVYVILGDSELLITRNVRATFRAWSYHVSRGLLIVVSSLQVGKIKTKTLYTSCQWWWWSVKRGGTGLIHKIQGFLKIMEMKTLEHFNSRQNNIMFIVWPISD